MCKEDKVREQVSVRVTEKEKEWIRDMASQLSIRSGTRFSYGNIIRPLIKAAMLKEE